MENINVNQLAGILKIKIDIEAKDNLQIRRIIIDSRKVVPGDAFVAIEGDKFDGHDFVDQAIEKGASAVIVGRRMEKAVPCFVVDNTRAALQQLAKHFLLEFDPIVIAVTGSTGKTTTKDMIHCALKEKYATHKTKGNFNNDIGMPLTILDLKREHEAVVLEMGMNNSGEIRELAGIAKPHIAVITNVGDSHIGRLGSKEKIFEAKMEICEGMSSGDVLVANGDDNFLKMLRTVEKPYRKVFAGCESSAWNDVYAENIMETAGGTRFTIVQSGARYECNLKVPGRHNVENAVLAYAAAVEAGVDPVSALVGIGKFEGDEIRGKRVEINGKILVNDTYNASPASMSAAIESFAGMEGRKIVVLGDMLELGDYSAKMHTEIGGLIADKGIDCLMATGKYAKFYREGALGKDFPEREIYIAENNEALAEMLKTMLKKGDSILFKGSHSTRMNDVYEEILKHA